MIFSLFIKAKVTSIIIAIRSEQIIEKINIYLTILKKRFNIYQYKINLAINEFIKKKTKRVLE